MLDPRVPIYVFKQHSLHVGFPMPLTCQPDQLVSAVSLPSLQKQIQNFTVYKLYFASLSLTTFLRAEINLPQRKGGSESWERFPKWVGLGGVEALLYGAAPALGCNGMEEVHLATQVQQWIQARIIGWKVVGERESDTMPTYHPTNDESQRKKGLNVKPSCYCPLNQMIRSPTAVQLDAVG